MDQNKYFLLSYVSHSSGTFSRYVNDGNNHWIESITLWTQSNLEMSDL